MSVASHPQVLNFMEHRRSVVAKQMVPTPPTEQELKQILAIGTRVPDHGKQTPWRIVVISGQARGEFGRQVLKPGFAAQNPEASEQTLEVEAQRFERAGVVLAVISAPTQHPKVPVWEMELSTGAVCAHLLIAAQAMGKAAQWLTEWPAFDESVLTALGGDPSAERIAGFIYIGEAKEAPTQRDRPALDTVVEYWAAL